MTGTLTHLVTKSKLAGSMDGIFVSSRTAQVLSEPGFRALCRDSRCVVAAETGKFLVGMKADTQQMLTAKEEELATQNGFRRIAGEVYCQSVQVQVQVQVPGSGAAFSVATTLIGVVCAKTVFLLSAAAS
jgi:hypothetical protein